MTGLRLILVGNGLDTRELAAALESFDIAVATVEMERRGTTLCDETWAAHRLSGAGPFDGVLLIPAFAEFDDPDLDDMLDVLSSCFSCLKAAIGWFEERGLAGRVISLLPGDATMGDPDDTVNSALAGAMLSLFRTVALEMRSTPITVNTLVFATRRADGTATSTSAVEPELLASMIATLLDSGMRSINGQEIYALAGADVGRLHP